MSRIRKQIGDTPLQISVYSVEKSSTTLHEKGTLEIIFCLKGSVKFSYSYEEFTLHAGEYISVDRDAYYLYDGNDNQCVSFYFDLKQFESKYPYICNNLFVCEGCRETTMHYPTVEHNLLKGMMIALLKHILEKGNEEIVRKVSERIIDIFVEHFDIFFFHHDVEISEEFFNRLHDITQYIYDHIKEKITIEDIAKKFRFTTGYMSEFIRSVSIGFRKMLSYIRANYSEYYLLKTDKTILEISEECGFSDVKYYYSAFKRWYKCTPKQFREKYGQMAEEHINYLEIEDIRDVLDDMMSKHYMETFLVDEGERALKE